MEVGRLQLRKDLCHLAKSRQEVLKGLTEWGHMQELSCLLANPLQRLGEQIGRRTAWRLEIGENLTGAIGVIFCCPSAASSQKSLLIPGVKLCRGGSPSTLQLIDKLSCHSDASSTYHKEEKKIICSVHMGKKARSLTSGCWDWKLMQLQGIETLQGRHEEKAREKLRACCCVHSTLSIYTHTRSTHLVSTIHCRNTQTQTHIHTPLHSLAHIYLAKGVATA